LRAAGVEMKNATKEYQSAVCPPTIAIAAAMNQMGALGGTSRANTLVQKIADFGLLTFVKTLLVKGARVGAGRLPIVDGVERKAALKI
jgi:hypothetical protein